LLDTKPHVTVISEL